MTEPAPELALAAICRQLVRLGRRFALVGGLAVSVRAEVRFTRDVDIAVAVADDPEAESLTYELSQAPVAAARFLRSLEARERIGIGTLVRNMAVKKKRIRQMSKLSASRRKNLDRRREKGDTARRRARCFTRKPRPRMLTATRPELANGDAGPSRWRPGRSLKEREHDEEAISRH